MCVKKARDTAFRHVPLSHMTAAFASVEHVHIPTQALVA